MSLPAFPRRYKAPFLGTIFLLSLIYLLSAISSPDSVPVPSAVRDHLPDHLPRPHLPDHIPDSIGKLNPFGPHLHKPPAVQTNSSAGTSKWHADWRWLNPFSWDVTRDEHRTVLPPLRERVPVYTFYETDKKTPADVKDAEQKMIYQWRRAWWAQGFRPIVLGRPEALQNPLYKKVQMLHLEDDIELELARWLAWDNMGGGILVEWKTFPMAKHDNPLLNFLRRGQYPLLTRYEGLKSGLFCGDKAVVSKALQEAIKKPELKKSLSLADSAFSKLFHIDTGHDGVAFYDNLTVSKKYKPVSDILFGKDHASGLLMLANLINAHLHSTWQNSFSEIAILNPLREHSTATLDPAALIAGNLTACPPLNPIPASCPPNRPKCRKCISSQPVPVAHPNSIRNATDRFYLGVVPHPFTTATLFHGADDLSVASVRNQGFPARDRWLTDVTSTSVQATTANRLSVLKNAVASDWALGRALWLTAEDAIAPTELQWIFGFAVPHSGGDAREAAKSGTPVPGDAKRPDAANDKRPEVVKLETQRALLEKAAASVRTKSASVMRGERVLAAERRRAVEAAESWSMGDAEAWRFVKAYDARRAMVRRGWERDERGFVGAERGGRWVDRFA